MQIAMMGLGRVGANLDRRLVQDGHNCVVYDRDLAAVDQLAALDGVTEARDLEQMVSLIDVPRAIWGMVPRSRRRRCCRRPGCQTRAGRHHHRRGQQPLP